MNSKNKGLPMTEALYFLDCYLKEFEATVEKVNDNKFVVGPYCLLSRKWRSAH